MSTPVLIDLPAVRNKLTQIQNDSRAGGRQIPLRVVSNLIFYTGLRLDEIKKLRERHVISNNNIVNQVTFKRKRDISRPTSRGSPLRIPRPGRSKTAQLTLPQNIRALLNGYVQSPRSGRVSPATGSLPLFRPYFGDSGKKKLTKDLKTYGTGFVELRRAGVIDFVTECRRRDPDPDRDKVLDRAVTSAADHFHITERTVEDYLKGIQRPAGRRTGQRRTPDDRGADLLYGLQSTEYEIFVENKVRELITEMEELFGELDSADNPSNWEARV